MALTPRLKITWPQALALSACLMALPAGLQAQIQGPNARSKPLTDQGLPTLGDTNSQSLSPAAERHLGDRIMRSILSDPDVVDDPLVLEYIQGLWSSLLASARQRGDISEELDASYAWTPFIIRDKTVNAFALPGGYIGVHLGLIALTRSPEELASVLAHEMSHVTQRHIARMMSQSKQTSWVGLATMVLGALAMSRSPQGAQALIMSGQGLAAQGQLNFSRDMEREADRVGFGVLTEAGYAPAGMMQMFEQLQQASRLNDDNNFPYLRTHPLTTERIGEARARMGTDGLSIRAINQTSLSERLQVLGLRHALMSARAKVLMDRQSAALQTWLKLPALGKEASATQQLAQLYTSLVAATQLKDRETMDRTLAQAQTLAGTLPAAMREEARRVLTLAEIEGKVETGRVSAAQTLLTDALGRPHADLHMSSRPEVLLRARVALNQSEARDQTALLQEAVNGLAPHLSAHPDDITGWTLQSAIWTRLGQPLRAIRAEAEAVAAAGDLRGAVDRVEAARKRFPQPNAADLIELSVLDARLVRWRQTLKDDAREELN
jgi:predicted Zn-dependent protease